MRRLIAVTSYFNPLGGRLRKRNYDVFRRELGLPLLTVEWSREGRFELSDDDAEVLLRVSGGDLLWQKERLLNIGMTQARSTWPGADLAFLDCDIVFAEAGWDGRVVEALDRFPAVQCYSTVGYLPEGSVLEGPMAAIARSTGQTVMPSLARALDKGRGLFGIREGASVVYAPNQTPLTGNPGMAIALRPDALPGFRFYERNVVGGGDLLLAAALAGRLEEAFTHRDYSAAHREDLRAWAARCISPDSRLGCVPEHLVHLWHGDLRNRRYSERNAILVNHGFDPVRDVDPEPSGGLRLAKGADALRRAVGEYLGSRNDA